MFIVEDLRVVPEGSRYVCSLDKDRDGEDMDIYETEECVVYGVKR